MPIKRRGSYRSWTMDDFDQVRTLWTTKTPSEIAEFLGRSDSQISNIAKRMREAGVDLPKKRRNAYVETLISDYVKRLKIKR